MQSVNQVRCGLLFCQDSEGEQTQLSVALRVTSIAVGVIGLVAGILILYQIPILSQIGTIPAYIILSAGACMILTGLALKCVKLALLDSLQHSTRSSFDVTAEEAEANAFRNIPDEIRLNVLRFLPKDLLSISLVSKDWLRLAHDACLLQSMMSASASPFEPLVERGVCSLKEAYYHYSRLPAFLSNIARQEFPQLRPLRISVMNDCDVKIDVIDTQQSIVLNGETGKKIGGLRFTETQVLALRQDNVISIWDLSVHDDFSQMRQEIPTAVSKGDLTVANGVSLSSRFFVRDGYIIVNYEASSRGAIEFIPIENQEESQLFVLSGENLKLSGVFSHDGKLILQGNQSVCIFDMTTKQLERIRVDFPISRVTIHNTEIYVVASSSNTIEVYNLETRNKIRRYWLPSMVITPTTAIDLQYVEMVDNIIFGYCHTKINGQDSRSIWAIDKETGDIIGRYDDVVDFQANEVKAATLECLVKTHKEHRLKTTHV